MTTSLTFTSPDKQAERDCLTTPAGPDWLTAIRNHASTEDVRQLLPYIDELHERLDRAEAALPGITHLIPGEPLKITMYSAEHSEDLEPLGLYTTREAARAHGESVARHDHKEPGRTYGWIPENGSPTAVEELSVFGPGEDDEDVTGYVVVPVTATSLYDPEAEE